MDYTLIIKALYFMLPAYFANMAPVLTKNHFKKLAIPVNAKLFGKNKTWRGFISAIIFAMIIAFIQQWIGWNSIIDYSKVNIWLLGFLLGFGAMFGDKLESFFKRRIGIPPGKPWYVFDQLDFPLGAMMFASFIVPFTWIDFTIIIVGTFVLTVLVNHISYWLGIRKVCW